MAEARKDQPLLTIAELARRYDLPESTARYYCKRFLPFLPHVGEGKRRRYRPGAVPVFEAIVEEMKERKDARSVEAVLEARFPRSEAAAARPEPAAPAPPAGGGQEALARLVEEQTGVLRGVAEALDRVAGRDAELEELRRRLAASEEATDKLLREMEAVRHLQDEAERIHQQDLEQLRKWLTSLARELSGSKT
jgi:DNA-binding transcriptional MerR regulator